LADQLLKLKQRIASLELVPSDGGVFEVSANGKVIHSKRATGEFPKPKAVLRAVQALR
jgi:selenoprotein W-related protein